MKRGLGNELRRWRSLIKAWIDARGSAGLVRRHRDRCEHGDRLGGRRHRTRRGGQQRRGVRRLSAARKFAMIRRLHSRRVMHRFALAAHLRLAGAAALHADRNVGDAQREHRHGLHKKEQRQHPKAGEAPSCEWERHGNRIMVAEVYAACVDRYCRRISEGAPVRRVASVTSFVCRHSARAHSPLPGRRLRDPR